MIAPVRAWLPESARTAVFRCVASARTFASATRKCTSSELNGRADTLPAPRTPHAPCSPAMTATAEPTTACSRRNGATANRDSRARSSLTTGSPDASAYAPCDPASVGIFALPT